METLIVNYNAREKRFAVIKDNTVEKIVYDRPEQRSLVGNIYFGTVTKVLPGMNAAFIDIGEEKNAYLHRNALVSYVLANKETNPSITSLVHQGEKLLVQVNKDATGTKGPRVTGIIELQGTTLIYIPNGLFVAVSKKIADENQSARLHRFGKQMKQHEEGMIFRTASIASDEKELADELGRLRLQYEELVRMTAAFKKPGLLFQPDTFNEMIQAQMAKMNAGEVIIDDLNLKKAVEAALSNKQVKVSFYSGNENIFSLYRVEREIEKALKRVVWLDKGAYLIFDETEALTIIDVNTGKFSGKTDYQATVLKTNELAAVEIVHQLRLRDIGGMVLIDFIDMKREVDRQAIIKLIETELMRDEKRTKIIGFTPLGILQLTRKRTKVSLSEALQVKCPVCEGTGRILSAETIAFRLERELYTHRHADFEAVLIETTKEVKEAFCGPGEAFKDEFEASLHLKIYFSIQPSLEHYYLVKQIGDADVIAQKAAEFY